MLFLPAVGYCARRSLGVEFYQADLERQQKRLLTGLRYASSNVDLVSRVIAYVSPLAIIVPADNSDPTALPLILETSCEVFPPIGASDVA